MQDESLIDVFLAKRAPGLKPHQVTGIRWLAGRLCKNESSLLADGCGLGKTVQALLAVAYVREHRGCENNFFAIVLCPASLQDQWKREADVWLGDSWSQFLEVQSYDSRKTPEECSLLILDEAHMLRNAMTTRWKRVKGWACQAKLALSATPIQNSVEELRCLLRLFMSEVPNSSGKTLLELPCVLQRTAESVLASELPARTERIIFVPMSKQQNQQILSILPDAGAFDAGDKDALLLMDKMQKILCNGHSSKWPGTTRVRVPYTLDLGCWKRIVQYDWVSCAILSIPNSVGQV